MESEEEVPFSHRPRFSRRRLRVWSSQHPGPLADGGSQGVRPPRRPPIAEGSQALVAAVTTDFSARLQAQPDDIQVQSVEGLEWPDASLRRPAPNELSAQVVPPGHRVAPEAHGEVHQGRTDDESLWVLFLETPRRTPRDNGNPSSTTTRLQS